MSGANYIHQISIIIYRLLVATLIDQYRLPKLFPDLQSLCASGFFLYSTQLTHTAVSGEWLMHACMHSIVADIIMRDSQVAL